MSKRSEPTLSSGAADVSISTIDSTITEAIRSTVAASIGGLADNLMQVIENQGSIVFNNVFQFSSVQFIFAISIICIYIYINIQIMKFEIKWRGSS